MGKEYVGVRNCSRADEGEDKKGYRYQILLKYIICIIQLSKNKRGFKIELYILSLNCVSFF